MEGVKFRYFGGDSEVPRLAFPGLGLILFFADSGRSVSLAITGQHAHRGHLLLKCLPPSRLTKFLFFGFILVLDNVPLSVSVFLFESTDYYKLPSLCLFLYKPLGFHVGKLNPRLVKESYIFDFAFPSGYGECEFGL